MLYINEGFRLTSNRAVRTTTCVLRRTLGSCIDELLHKNGKSEIWNGFHNGYNYRQAGISHNGLVRILNAYSEIKTNSNDYPKQHNPDFRRRTIILRDI